MQVIALPRSLLNPQNMSILDTKVQTWLDSCYPHQYQLYVNWYGAFLHLPDLSDITAFELAWLV